MCPIFGGLSGTRSESSSTVTYCEDWGMHQDDLVDTMNQVSKAVS